MKYLIFYTHTPKGYCHYFPEQSFIAMPIQENEERLILQYK